MTESPELRQARRVNNVTDEERMPNYGGGSILEDGGLGDRA
jgi:hypothetical protein